MATGTAQLISTAQMMAITDKAAKAYDVLDPYLGSGSGTLTGGYWGQRLLGYVVGLEGTYYGLGDHYKIDDIGPGAQNFADNLLSENFWQTAAASLINGLTTNLSKYGPSVSTTIKGAVIDTYADYYNAATAHSMTYASSFAKLYYYFKGKDSMLTATNVLSTSVTLGYATVVDATTATFTDGDAIVQTSTVSAGVQGYAADNFYLEITDGTLIGTVTVTGIHQSLATVTYSAVGSYVSSGTIDFTPATAGDRTYDSISLAYSGEATAASFDIKTTSRTLA